jgi:hypothetical protein
MLHYDERPQAKCDSCQQMRGTVDDTGRCNTCRREDDLECGENLLPLVAGMFDIKHGIGAPRPRRPFGLMIGQMRATEHDCKDCNKRVWGKDACLCPKVPRPICHKLAHNGRWYNKSGESLGWGDICTCDLRRIADEMDPTDVFYILSEHDAYNVGINHSLEFIQQQCRIAIHGGKVYEIARGHGEPKGEIVVEKLTMHQVSRDHFKKLVD